MEYRQYILGDLQTNCYLLWSGEEAGVIDPGGPVDEVIQEMDNRQLKLKWIVNTHGHADHIYGNKVLQETYHCPIMIHPADQEMLLSPMANLSAFIGFYLTSPDAGRLLKGGDLLELGSESLQIIDTPGHTPGGIALYVPDLLFSGDTLFYESVGRTDLPGGDHGQLIQSIKNRLFNLPSRTMVLPGHGPVSSIQHELKSNPYLRAEDEVSY